MGGMTNAGVTRTTFQTKKVGYRNSQILFSPMSQLKVSETASDAMMSFR